LAFKAIRRLSPDFPLWRDFPYEYERGKLAIDVINGGPLLREWVDDAAATPQDLDALAIKDEQAWLGERAAHPRYRRPASPPSHVATPRTSSLNATRSARAPVTSAPRSCSSPRKRAGVSDAARSASSSGRCASATALRTAVAMSRCAPARVPPSVLS